MCLWGPSTTTSAGRRHRSGSSRRRRADSQLVPSLRTEVSSAGGNTERLALPLSWLLCTACRRSLPEEAQPRWRRCIFVSVVLRYVSCARFCACWAPRHRRPLAGCLLSLLSSRLLYCCCRAAHDLGAVELAVRIAATAVGRDALRRAGSQLVAALLVSGTARRHARGCCCRMVAPPLFTACRRCLLEGVQPRATRCIFESVLLPLSPVPPLELERFMDLARDWRGRTRPAGACCFRGGVAACGGRGTHAAAVF